MDLSKIPFGKNFPSEVNVVVEIPQNSIGLKYEIDKELNSGSFSVAYKCKLVSQKNKL